MAVEGDTEREKERKGDGERERERDIRAPKMSFACARRERNSETYTPFLDFSEQVLDAEQDAGKKGSLNQGMYIVKPPAGSQGRVTTPTP